MVPFSLPLVPLNELPDGPDQSSPADSTPFFTSVFFPPSSLCPPNGYPFGWAMSSPATALFELTRCQRQLSRSGNPASCGRPGPPFFKGLCYLPGAGLGNLFFPLTVSVNFTTRASEAPPQACSAGSFSLSGRAIHGSVTLRVEPIHFPPSRRHTVCELFVTTAVLLTLRHVRFDSKLPPDHFFPFFSVVLSRSFYRLR